MYQPSEEEKNNCAYIIKDILKNENDIVTNVYVEEVFKIAYSIGGDYSERTLRPIAEVLLKKEGIHE